MRVLLVYSAAPPPTQSSEQLTPKHRVGKMMWVDDVLRKPRELLSLTDTTRRRTTRDAHADAHASPCMLQVTQKCASTSHSCHALGGMAVKAGHALFPT